MTSPPVRRPLRAVLALAALLLPLAGARALAATDTVSGNSDDYTAGTLPSAVSSNTNAGGGDTIQWSGTNGGTIVLTTQLLTIATATVDFSLANASVTIAGVGAGMSISSTVVFNVGAAQPAGISATVADGPTAGALVKTGAGTLDLYNANSYSGGTVLNAGTLRLDNTGALGSGPLALSGGTLAFNVFGATITNTVTIANGATLDLLGNNAGISGVIQGSGGLTVANSTGTLVLTGANTFTGGLTVNAGATVNINSDSALGDASNTVALSNAGVLQLANAMTIAHAISLGSGGGIVDTNGFDGTITGNITGAGGLTKNSGGTLTLGNSLTANTYSGGTTINGGTVALGVNNALGTGSINLANGSVLDMGSFTQNSSASGANYGGTGTVRLTLGGSTNLTVNNNADLSNTTLQVSLPVQTPHALNGAQYSFNVVSAGGTLTAPSASNIVGPALIKFTPSVAGGVLSLKGDVQPITSVAATGNQSGVGAMLRASQLNPTGDMATVLGQIYSMDAAHVQAALDQISPVTLGAMSGIGMAQAGLQSAAVSRRMAALADGTGGAEFSNYAVSQPRRPGPLLAEPPGDTDGGETPETPEFGSPWGFFAAGVLSAGRVTELTSDAGVQPGYAFNNGGLTVGADYKLADGFAVGLSGGYLHGHSSLYAPSAGTIDNNSVRYGAYALRSKDNFHADLYVGGATDKFTTQRVISIGSINRTASGSPSATELDVRPSLSYDQKILDWGIFSPFAALDYDRMAINAFTETGADSLNLSVAGQTAESLQSTLGLRYSQKLSDGIRTYIPYGSLGWRHEYDPQSRPIQAQLASGAGGPFTVRTGNVARDGTLVGLGLSLDWHNGIVAKADWAGDFRSHYQDSLFNLSVRYRF